MTLADTLESFDASRTGLSKTEWFTPEYLEREAPLGGLTPEDVQKLLEGYRALSSEQLAQLRRIIACLYVDAIPLPTLFPEDPMLNELWGDEQAELFHTLMVLGGYKHAHDAWKEQGFGEDLLQEALPDLKIWIKNKYRNSGRFGISWGIVGWQQGFLNATRVSLGRLQFDLKHRFIAEVKLFVSKDAAQSPVILADTGLPIAPDGLSYDHPQAIPAVLTETEVAWTGRPVNLQTARFEARDMTLSKSQWHVAVEQGTPMINVHIPESGPLAPDACLDSFQRLESFMAEHFPEAIWPGFCCYSWLLDPQFKQLLPDTSNMLKFQDFGHQFPIPGGADTKFRVFGTRGFNGVANPNSLQRTFRDFVNQGGTFRNGAWIRLVPNIG